MTAANKITSGKEARQKLLQGVETLYQAVSSTLGARSRTVGIDYGFQKKIIQDGVGVARVILPEDPVEQFAASIVTEAAKKTVDEVGDGTTATIILAHAFITEAHKLIEAGVEPTELIDGLEKGVEVIIKEIEKISKPVKTLEEKINVATVSAKDRELGELIAKTIDKAGLEGVVTVEESKSNETYVDWQEGMQFDKGYASPYFVTNPDTMEATLTDTKVLVTDRSINPNDLLPLFREVFEKKSAPLTIIGSNIPDALRDFLVVNKLQGKIRALYIVAPLAGDKQNSFLQDIAILTGAKFISEQAGETLENVTFEDLGTARRITSYAASTEIVGGKGKKDEIKQRVAHLAKQIKETESDFEKEKFRERYAKLTNGVAVINVGGRTEVEMQERKERVHDAVWATRAAIDEGIVPGGEIVYLSAINKLPKEGYANIVLRNALSKPFKKLMSNAGLDAGQMLERLINSGSKGKKKYVFSKDSGLTAEDIAGIDMEDPEQYLLVEGNAHNAIREMHVPLQNAGVDVTDGKVKDMVKAGIIDPLAVIKSALRNSLSVSIKIMTTDTVVVPIPEDKKAK